MSFSLTRKTDYALVALSSLAREKLENGDPLSARQLSVKYDLPLPLLMNALKELHRAGIISSRRGAGGGYYLGHEPEEITVKEVIEALEGPVSVTLCSDEHPEISPVGKDPVGKDPVGKDPVGKDPIACQLHCFCPISDPMQRFNLMLTDFLSKVTLKSLIAGEHKLVLPSLGVHV